MVPSLRTVQVCGLPVLAESLDVVVDELERRTREGIGTRVVTLNLEMVARSRRDPAYGDWLKNADFIVPDGMPIVWAIKRRDRSAKIKRVTGVDLTSILLQKVPSSQIGIVGGVNPAVAIAKLNVPQASDLALNSERLAADEKTFDLIARQMEGRRLIFLALGVPKQDAFAVALRTRMPQAVLLPNGGSFELIAGQTSRAPGWMQGMGLEWLFRLLVEPRRLWRRYLIEYWAGAIKLLFDRPI